MPNPQTEQAIKALDAYNDIPFKRVDTSAWGRDDFDLARDARRDHLAASATSLAAALSALLSVPYLSPTVYTREDGKHGFRLTAPNGNIILGDANQGYENLADAEDIASRIRFYPKASA